MSSSSPQSSMSNGAKSPTSSAANDANIRNFAPVARIMKTALPENAKIAKEAKECMQECVSEFISFITSEGTFQIESKENPKTPLMSCRSLGEVPAGEAQDCQRRGHSLCHDITGLRELLGGPEDLPVPVPRGKLSTFLSFQCFHSPFVSTLA